MTEKHLITAASCLRGARLFNLLAIATTLLAASLFGLGQMMAALRERGRVFGAEVGAGVAVRVVDDLDRPAAVFTRGERPLRAQLVDLEVHGARARERLGV